ncbi:MAG: hypothetical protein MAG453_01614 [Calditrichaeota bacterium]|nr:hypothetical protein [Calditrichota bacterium]
MIEGNPPGVGAHRIDVPHARTFSTDANDAANSRDPPSRLPYLVRRPAIDHRNYRLMITHTFLEHLFAWFDRYTDPYLHSGNPSHAKTHRLKYDHTLRVVAEMERLVEALALPDEDRRLARAIALLHDLGRFEQLRIYDTLRDPDSEDHAGLGVKEIRRTGVLAELLEPGRTLIERAVHVHNKLAIPDTYRGRDRHFAKLIRDADKLDILHVFILEDASDDEDRRRKAYLGLAELDTVSEGILDTFDRGRMARLETMNSRNDMRLLMLSWVFDFNFAHSLRRMRDRGDSDRLFARIPDTPRVRRARAAVERILADPERALAERELDPDRAEP